MKSGFKRAVVLATLVSLPGCALLGGGSKPLDTYEISAPQAPTNGRRHRRTQILVAEPAALKSLDGQNIVVKPGAGAVQFLDGAQWADRLPKIVQAGLIETFRNSGRLGGVGRPGEGLAIDYQVTTEIRAFEIRTGGGAHVAHVALSMRVLNDRNGVVRAARDFEASSVAIGGSNPDFVDALDRAFDDVAVDVVSWAISVM